MLAFSDAFADYRRLQVLKPLYVTLKVETRESAPNSVYYIFVFIHQHVCVCFFAYTFYLVLCGKYTYYNIGPPHEHAQWDPIFCLK